MNLVFAHTNDEGYILLLVLKQLFEPFSVNYAGPALYTLYVFPKVLH